MAPTGASGISLVVAILLGMISLRISNAWLLLIAVALVAPALISQLLRPKLSSMSVCFGSEGAALPGATCVQYFHVHNRGRRSSPALQLGHAARGLAPITLAVPALPPGGIAHLKVDRAALARGVTELHDLRLSTTAPFGMALHQARYPVVARITVHPAPGPVATLPGAGQDAGGGQPDRLGEETHELREWRRGDSLRQVHWRATARHDRLVVVIPEQTVHSRVALVIDGTKDAHFEALISTAASTAVQAVRANGVLRLSAAGNPDYV